MPDTEQSDSAESLSESNGNAVKKGLSKRQRVWIAIAFWTLVLIAVGVGFGAKAWVQRADSERATKAARTATPAKKPLSESEARYATYLKTLSPKQRAVRESLNPDALAAMDEAQLTDVFTIREREVVVNGKIDPLLYAEAFTARIDAMHNAGISSMEYAKWGGHDKIGRDTIAKIEDNYFKPESQALFGYAALDEDSYLTILTFGEVIDQLIQGHLNPKPSERFHYRATVEPDSIKPTREANGTLDISFTSHFSENWQADADVMAQSNLQRDPSLSDGVDRWDIAGLHITGDGAILPTRIDVN